MSDEQKDNWFFAWPEPDPQAAQGVERAAILKAAMWDRRATIKISFLEEDPANKELQAVVKKYAQQWIGPGMANLTFQWVPDPQGGDIRISFLYQGSWSVIGKTCLNLEKNRATMNYGKLKEVWGSNAPIESKEDESRRVVIHEFGHALGLLHEHQSPAANIQWNRDYIIRELSGHPNYWDVDKITINVFKAYEEHETNFTNYDPSSIMMYPFPPQWTLDGRSAELNKDLSPMDRWIIRKWYPGV